MMHVHLRLIAKLKKKWVRKIHVPVHVNIQNLWWSLCGLVIILQKKPCWWAIGLLYCIRHQIDDLFEKKCCQMSFSLTIATRMVTARSAKNWVTGTEQSEPSNVKMGKGIWLLFLSCLWCPFFWQYIALWNKYEYSL